MYVILFISLYEVLTLFPSNVFPHSTFNWVGIDGTQVLCHMTPVGKCSIIHYAVPLVLASIHRYIHGSGDSR